MKTRTKIILSLALACAGTLVLAACGGGDRSKEYEENGFTVTVHYEPNGGQFAGKDGVSFTYFYHQSKAGEGIRIAPPDQLRQDNPFERSGYFLSGWYLNRELRTDEAGTPLDEYGEPVSVSGRNQGYVYSDRWNFEDLLYQSDFAEEGQYSLTLYAAWVPNFTFEFYSENASGVWEQYDTFVYDPTVFSEIELPAYNLETGAMEYGYFPQKTGSTFLAAYADEGKTEQLEKITRGTYDEERGIGQDMTKKVYVEWRDGLWFKIETAEQLVSNARMDGCYEIYNDLHFENGAQEGLSWPNAFANGTFAGTFEGYGHAISGVKVVQSNVNTNYGGLFGRITAEASFHDISFTDITYVLAAASRYQGAQFGLFAGELSAGAHIDKVSVSGELVIGDPDGRISLYPQQGAVSEVYSVGLVSGNLIADGIDADITYSCSEGYSATLDEGTGEITITVVS